LERVLPQLPAEVLSRWQHAPMVVASERLAGLARDHGFVRVCRATGPRPAQLLAAGARAGG
ncbi:hypothetical protein, partial [Paraburkholderia sp. SIMBA_054]|uniref:hypothetical protein n=1 Tax=Paraburkholderia sp. SIMBA_054 TaxID=3085795 RepID=UPI0039796BC2